MSLSETPCQWHPENVRALTLLRVTRTCPWLPRPDLRFGDPNGIPFHASHADKEDEFSLFTKAYQATQPQKIYAEEEEEEDEQEQQGKAT